MKKILLMLLCVSVLGCSKNSVESEKPVDVLLIGGGIMSATLGTYLNELEPGWTIEMVERLDKVAEESSNGWNNAGTGHSAFCELNYTSEAADGSMDISKAVAINENFEISKQFWAYQVDRKVLNDPKSFINNVPHMSFVWGDDNVAFLKKRHAALQHSSLFRGMEYSEDPEQIKQWVPLVMEGREPGQKIAATRMSIGTDVNFGEITRQLVGSLSAKDTFKLRLQHARTSRRPSRLTHSEATITAPPRARRGRSACWFQISRLSSNPTGTCRLFITARVPASTSVAPLFHQNWPRAVASSPIHTSTPHCSSPAGRRYGSPNSSQAGNATSSAPTKK